jgi:hypothetical protein
MNGLVLSLSLSLSLFVVVVVVVSLMFCDRQFVLFFLVVKKKSKLD